MTFESITIPVEPKRKDLSILDVQPVSKNKRIQSLRAGSYFCTSMRDDQEINFNFGKHPVFNGFLWAYKNHRPITISPDIIWILITQAFSNHVSSKAEELRSMFVNFEGKTELLVQKPNLDINTMTSTDWEREFFPEFVDQISQYTGQCCTDTLTPNFTTTTPISLAVGQLSIMSTMKHYFSFRGMVCGCGIPFITIEGSVEDWTKINEKLTNLSKYKFEWFTKDVTPIVDKIIQTKQGKIDKKFWKDMIRIKDGTGFYDPDKVDGWFTKFFPFDDEGDRNHGFIEKGDDLQNEMLEVPFTLDVVYPDRTVRMSCNIYAGFVGLTQNKESGSFKPEIGWLIKEKSSSTL